MIKPSPFKRFKTSLKIICLAVMMYVQFPLLLRNIEDLLHKRDIYISYETVRYWWHRFDTIFASGPRNAVSRGCERFTGDGILRRCS